MRRRAVTALKGKGQGFHGPRGLPDRLPGDQGSGRALRSGKFLGAGEPVSYLAGLAGVVEGVDVLGGEAHHAVDAIELCAPGGVAGVAAQRCGWRGARVPPTAEARAARRAAPAACNRAWWAPRPGRSQAQRPGGGGERRAGPPKAPAAPRCFQRRAGDAWQAPPTSAGNALAKGGQILMQPPGVSTEGHQAEVVGAQQGGDRGLLPPSKSLHSPFLISENLSLSQPEISMISSPSTSKRKKQHWRH